MLCIKLCNRILGKIDNFYYLSTLKHTKRCDYRLQKTRHVEDDTLQHLDENIYENAAKTFFLKLAT